MRILIKIFGQLSSLQQYHKGAVSKTSFATLSLQVQPLLLPTSTDISIFLHFFSLPKTPFLHPHSISCANLIYKPCTLSINFFRSLLMRLQILLADLPFFAIVTILRSIAWFLLHQLLPSQQKRLERVCDQPFSLFASFYYVHQK